MKTQLLCTFTNTENYDETIKTIIGAYEIIFNKIYVFTNKDDENDIMCTYNVDPINLGNFISNTISLHRKKQTNTLYTINALNEVIKSLNGGILDSIIGKGAALAGPSGLFGAGLGSLGGMNLDIGTSVGVIKSVTQLFDCDPEPECSPNDVHTMQGGGGDGARNLGPSAAGSGTTNTGGGGGGAGPNPGSSPNGLAGTGGSGIVIIRYQFQGS